MAKYKFKDTERYAVYKVLGPKCIWCQEPVAYRDSELDHVLPESLKKTEVEELIIKFKLHENFKINSFYNWAPIHTRCNRGKSDKTFDNAPLFCDLLHRIRARVPEIEELHLEAKRIFSNPITAAQLENAIKTKRITKSDIDALFNKNISKVNSSTFYNSINCRAISINQKGKYGTKSPKQLYSIDYKQFETEIKPLVELNCLIKAEAIGELMNARENYHSYLKDFGEDDYFADMDSVHEFGMYFTLVSKPFVSYTSTVRFYHTGAAHEQYMIIGKNFYLDALRPFILTNMLIDYSYFINTITSLAYDKMIKELKSFEPDVEITDYAPIEKSWLTSEFKAFENYHFTEKSLVFIFNPYQISAWIYGAHFPEFTFDELITLFPHETKLIQLINSIKKSTRASEKNKK